MPTFGEQQQSGSFAPGPPTPTAPASVIEVDPLSGHTYQTINGERIRIITPEEVRRSERGTVRLGTESLPDGRTRTVTENADGTYRVEVKRTNGTTESMIERADISSVRAMQGQRETVRVTPDPGERGIQDVLDTTILEGDSLEERQRKAANIREEFRRRTLEQLAAYKQGDGYDLAAALAVGAVDEPALRQSGFTSDDVNAARASNESRAQTERIASAQDRAAQDERAKLDDIQERIKQAGGLAGALQSDDERRITRADALALGYTDDQIAQAFRDEERYVSELGAFESDVREGAERQRFLENLQAQPDVYDPATGTYDLVAALDFEDATRLQAIGGFSPEQVQEAERVRAGIVQQQTGQTAANAETQRVLDQLAPFRTEGDKYQAGLALASGAVTEQEIRTVYGDEAQAVIDQAAGLREAADAGYYVSGDMVPDSLRRTLLVRSAELSANIERTGGAFPGVASAQQRDIAIIDDFLQHGGPIPDVRVAELDRRIETVDARLHDHEQEYQTALSFYGPDDDIAIRARDMRDVDQRDRDQLLTERRAAVSVALTTPTPALASNKLEQVYAGVKAHPERILTGLAKEVALAYATGAAATLAFKAGIAAARGIGKIGDAAGRAGAYGFGSIGGGLPVFVVRRPISTAENEVARRLLAQVEREYALAAEQARLVGPQTAFSGAGSPAALEQTLRALRARQGDVTIALSDGQVARLVQAGSGEALQVALREVEAEGFNISVPQPAQQVREQAAASSATRPGVTARPEPRTNTEPASRPQKTIDPALPTIAVEPDIRTSLDVRTAPAPATPLATPSRRASTAPATDTNPATGFLPSTDPAPDPSVPPPPTDPTIPTTVPAPPPAQPAQPGRGPRIPTPVPFTLPDGQTLPVGVYPAVIEFVWGLFKHRVNLITGDQHIVQVQTAGAPEETLRVVETGHRRPRRQRYTQGAFSFVVNGNAIRFTRERAVRELRARDTQRRIRTQR